jgi:hypothetical protein
VRRASALLLAAVLAIAACSDDGGGDDGAARPDPSTTTTAAPAETTTTAAPAPLAGAATCDDEGADTREFSPGADIVGVELTATDGGLVVRYRLVGPVPTTGSTMWSVFAREPDGENIQFGARLEGETRSPFVFHFGDEIQQDLPAEAMVVGTDTIEVSYPARVVDLHAPFDWRAESTVEVEDVDYCPGGADASVLDDERLPFT